VVVGAGAAAAPVIPQGGAVALVDANGRDGFADRTPARAMNSAPIAVLPAQKGGATHYLPVGGMHAIKAEAHTWHREVLLLTYIPISRKRLSGLQAMPTTPPMCPPSRFPERRWLISKRL
jgi:hypothetical protein